MRDGIILRHTRRCLCVVNLWGKVRHRECFIREKKGWTGNGDGEAHRIFFFAEFYMYRFPYLSMACSHSNSYFWIPCTHHCSVQQQPTHTTRFTCTGRVYRAIGNELNEFNLHKFVMKKRVCSWVCVCVVDFSNRLEHIVQFRLVSSIIHASYTLLGWWISFAFFGRCFFRSPLFRQNRRNKLLPAYSPAHMEYFCMEHVF